MKQRNHTILEYGIYLLIWVIVLLVPVLGYSYDGAISWPDVFRLWLAVLPFFLLFVLNNNVLVPCFLFKKKYGLYVISALAAITLLFAAIPVCKGPHNGFPPPFMVEKHMETMSDSLHRPIHPMHRFHEKQHGHRPDSAMGRNGMHKNRPRRPVDMDPDRAGLRHMPTHGAPASIGNFRPKPLPPGWAPMLHGLMLAVLLVGFNDAIRYLFKSIRDARHLKELESQNLRAELNYLKAQVNPHFFMNTLNNIHALVDIDTEKAKETVVELSKIMRYVLYDADQPFVPLGKEVQFLKNYVGLMRIRYTDEVDIRTEYPETVPDVKIPPLLLVTLVENAFKHGISYRNDSFVHTELCVEDGTVSYKVRNSIAPGITKDSGVGLENLGKRLTLLYGDNFTLDVNVSDKEYCVTMVIPLEK